MAVNAYHVEAWSLPFSTTAQVVARVPFIAGSFSADTSGPGRGSVTLDQDYPDLDLIVHETGPVVTYLRVYQDGTLIPEASFFARRLAKNVDDTGTVTITGPGLGHVLDWGILENYDYPDSPTVDPTWQWGSTKGAGSFTNGGLEDDPDGLNANGSFETGAPTPFVSTPADAFFNASFVSTSTSYARTGTISLAASLSQGDANSGAQATVSLVEEMTKRLQFQGYMLDEDNLGEELVMGVQVDDGYTTHSANGWVENGFAWIGIGNAAKGAGTSTSSFQVCDLDVTFPEEQTSTTWVFMTREAPSTRHSIFIDDVSIAGPGIGTDPWTPAAFRTGGDETTKPTVNTFKVSTARVRTGTYALEAQGTVPAGSTGARLGAMQRVDSLTPGKTYTWAGYVSHTAGGAEDFRAIVQVPGGERIAETAVTSVATGSAFARLSVSFVAVGNEVQASCRWSTTGPDTSPTMYFDDWILHEGLPAATVGDIWQTILDDASTDHTGEAGDLARDTLDFLDYTSFTAVLDSATNAWTSGETDGTIAYRGKRGKRYTRIRADHQRLGYEFQVVDSATGPTLNTHNPYDWTTRTGGIGTDQRTSLPAITYRQGITGGPVIKQVLTPNVVHGEGDSGLWDRGKATTTLDAFELYDGDQDLTSSQAVADLVERVLEDRTDPTVALKVTLAPFDTAGVPVPWDDFSIGDTLTLDLAGDFSGDKRVVKITTNFTSGWGRHEIELDQTTYTSDPVKAVAEAVRRLLDQFDALSDLVDDDDTGAAAPAFGDFSGPIDHTYTVAASDSRPEIVALADFVCDGTNDEEEIELALAAADALTGVQGEVLLYAGTYNVDVTTGPLELWQWNVGLRGESHLSTSLYLSATAPVTYGIEMGSGHLRDVFVGEAFSSQIDYMVRHFDAEMSDVDVSNNSGGSGILSTGSVWATNCTVNSVDGDGWVIRSSVSGSDLLAPVLVNCRASNIDGHGFKVEASGAVLVGLTARDCAKGGTFDGINVSGDTNQIIGYYSYGTGHRSGIRFETGADNNKYVGHSPNATPVDDNGTGNTDLAGDVVDHTHTGGDGGTLSHDDLTDQTPEHDLYQPFSQSGTVTTTTGAHRFYIRHSFDIIDVEATVGNAPSGGSVVVDVNITGTSIYSTGHPTITTGTNTSGVAAPDGTSTGASGDYVTVDVDSTTAPASDLTVIVRYRRT